MYIAKIAIEKSTFAFDKLFDYIIPKNLIEIARIGCRVIIPFGKGNNKMQGMIFSVVENENLEGLKEIIQVVDELPIFNQEMFELTEYLVKNTFCTYYDAIKAILPSGLNYKFENGKIKRQVNDNLVKLYKLSDNYSIKKVTAKQQEVIDCLIRLKKAQFKELSYESGCSKSVIDTLVKNKIIEFELIEAYNAEIGQNATKSLDEIVLSDEQNGVFNGVVELIDQQKPAVALLQGITGSGKTQVFLKLIETVVKQGKQALMLVPEIALTPQMVGNFKQLYGDNVAVIHSNLSVGQKLDEWKRIKEKKANIVVGTRSACFSPCENIGIIIMDEEGETSYKSDAAPRYHAREVAKFRCVSHNAVLLLASATPSIESYYNAKIGKYSLFELNNRYSNAILPEVYIVDLNDEENINDTIISDVLIQELNNNLQKGEQSILLLNRRGHSTFAICRSCEKVDLCPNCTVSLTYHKANGMMMCHYCGYAHRHTATCKYCGMSGMQIDGMGTQRLEDDLKKILCSARVLRMDTDTTFSKASYDKYFNAFANNEYDILIGTQMIAKGLNFPNVTLVGVLSIDQLLYSNNFKSNERTFSLITQVVGRSGRGDKKGRAYIQSICPQNPVITFAAKQDFKAFYDDEIQIRKASVYPPFCDLCIIGISGIDKAKTKTAAMKLLDIIKQNAAEETKKLPLVVLGPITADIFKVNNKYRYRIVIKCKANNTFKHFMANVLKKTATKKEFFGINLFADINGEVNF